MTGTSLSNISALALLFDSEPENIFCHITPGTRALGVGSSNSRSQKGWLGPALPGVSGRDIVMICVYKYRDTLPTKSCYRATIIPLCLNFSR